MDIEALARGFTCEATAVQVGPSIFSPTLTDLGKELARGSEGKRRLTECQSTPSGRSVTPTRRAGDSGHAVKKGGKGAHLYEICVRTRGDDGNLSMKCVHL